MLIFVYGCFLMFCMAMVVVACKSKGFFFSDVEKQGKVKP